MLPTVRTATPPPTAAPLLSTIIGSPLLSFCANIAAFYASIGAAFIVIVSIAGDPDIGEILSKVVVVLIPYIQYLANYRTHVYGKHCKFLEWCWEIHKILEHDTCVFNVYLVVLYVTVFCYVCTKYIFLKK